MEKKIHRLVMKKTECHSFLFKGYLGGIPLNFWSYYERYKYNNFARSQVITLMFTLGFEFPA